jgi:hypothetical protein
LFGFDESKAVNDIIGEMITRVNGLIGHFEKTVKSCKLEFSPTEIGFTVKNHADPPWTPASPPKQPFEHFQQ